ncbi:MAG: hypothetical protein WBP22_05355 [Candidatus Saccharimonas sp.]
MPWEVKTITRLIHTGRPDDSIGKIRLEDGTELVITDDYPNYPQWSAALHPSFIPDNIQEIRQRVLEQVSEKVDDPSGITLDGVVARLSSESLVVGEYVTVIVQFGRWNPFIEFEYNSPVAEIIGSTA